MNKGKVIKVEKHYSTLITTSGEFVNIKNKGTMYVGQNVIFTEYDIYNNKSKIIAFKTVAAVLALVVILNAYFKIWNSNTAYAVVSIDINPSIELQIDDKFKVLEIEACNEDGNEIIDKSFIGMQMSDVVKNIVNNAKQKKYLNENGDILIATAILTEEKISADEISDIIYEKIFKEDDKVNVYMVSSTKEDYEQANKKDISLGKYKVAKTSKKDIDIAQVKNQSVKQLKEKNILNKKEIVNKRDEKEKEKIEKNKEKEKKDKEDKKDKEKIKDNEIKEDNTLSGKLKDDIKEVDNINDKFEKQDKEQGKEQGNKENKNVKKDILENKKKEKKQKLKDDKKINNNKIEKDNKNKITKNTKK